jgi:predicted rRNA methylase YqxC with S4 and FtsJ domains
VRDRTNALHVRLAEPVTLVAVDVGWTKQGKILPVVAGLLPADAGDVLTLIKPHYESELAKTQRGVLSAAQSEEVLWQVIDQILSPPTGTNGNGRWMLKGIVQSPLEGQKGNVEYVSWLQPRPA